MTDKGKHIDQLIQDKLLEYQEQPPAHIWSALQPNTTMLWIKRGVAAVFMLAAAMAAYFWFVQKGNIDKPTSQNITKNILSSPDTDITTQKPNTNNTFEHSTNNTKVDKTNEKTTYKHLENKPNKVPKTYSQKDNYSTKNMPTYAEVMKAITLQKNRLGNTSYNIIKNNSNSIENKLKNRWVIEKLDCIVLSCLPNIYAINLPQPNKLLYALQAGKDFKDIDKQKSTKTFDNNWAFGLELSPEWTKLQESHTTMQSYGIDFFAHKYFNQWYLASGIGFSYSTDNGKYEVDYKKSEYKGSYQYVDSVDFEIDNNNNVTPIFYTTRIDVYDTIDKVHISENKNKYFYINIPLYIGYEYALGKRWHANIYTGLRSGILVHKNIPNPDLEDNVFLVKNIYNDRKDFYLQGQMGIGLDYQLHKRWYLGLSPNMSYYFISPIGNEDKKPYALGLRFGIKYKWNK